MKQAKQKHCNKNNNRATTTEKENEQQTRNTYKKKNKQPITKQNKTMCKHKVGKWIRKEKKNRMKIQKR